MYGAFQSAIRDDTDTHKKPDDNFLTSHTHGIFIGYNKYNCSLVYNMVCLIPMHQAYN